MRAEPGFSRADLVAASKYYYGLMLTGLALSMRL